MGFLLERSVHPSAWTHTILDFDIYYNNSKIFLVAKRLSREVCWTRKPADRVLDTGLFRASWRTLRGLDNVLL